MTTMVATSAPAVNDPGQVELILAQIESLPTLPSVAVRLLELVADETASARELVELIELDKSLSARLLAMVARSNTGCTATTVERAVVLLGFEAVRGLVLSIQIFETFSQRLESFSGRFDHQGFWKHSLGVGCAARLLAEACEAGRHGRSPGPNGDPASSLHVPRAPVSPEEAFVCGLLHDIGKAALSAAFPKSYDRVVAAVETGHGSISDAERKVFGVDHTITGQRLATHWKLPLMIRECIWLHHHQAASTPNRIAHRQAVGLVQLADRLVRQIGIGYSGNYEQDVSPAALAEDMGISANALAQVRSALPELVQERAVLIGLDRLTSRDIYNQAINEASAELARIQLALAEANHRLDQRSRCLEAMCVLNSRQTEEPSHEEVCRGAARAAGILAAGGKAAVVCFSSTRWIWLLAACEGNDEPRLDMLPAGALEGLGPLSEVRGAWVPASLLPGLLLDHVVAVLGEPPAWCWPIRHHLQFRGAFVLTGAAGIEPGESFAALSDATAAWLNAAESRMEARQLNEDLAEMNRLLTASQAQAARMQSLAMVGEMAAGAAHELNNPLAVISGRAQLLNVPDAAEEVQRSASVIVEQADRASAIVTELMDFAKPAAPRATEWRPAELLAEIRRAWIEQGPLAAGQFQLTLSDDLPNVVADSDQIRKLFDELIRNSCDAMRETSAPCLSMNCHGEVADDRIVIRVQDNGCGMAPEVMERAMDPFFSHRPAGRGRGLGLSRAARYAQINGGRIRLSSEVNAGTTVFVELPTRRPEELAARTPEA